MQTITNLQLSSAELSSRRFQMPGFSTAMPVRATAESLRWPSLPWQSADRSLNGWPNAHFKALTFWPSQHQRVLHSGMQSFKQSVSFPSCWCRLICSYHCQRGEHLAVHCRVEHFLKPQQPKVVNTDLSRGCMLRRCLDSLR